MPVQPSRCYLPKFNSSPRTIFDFLLARFPQVGEGVWRERVSQCRITLNDGTVITEDTPYRHGVTVLYQKEVPSEPSSFEDPVILYRNDEILVADKPPGIPVTPSGEYVERSLLFRLQRSLGLPDLAPMHRLDHETAGLVLFAVRRDVRSDYHQLFAEGKIEREYVALAHTDASLHQRYWRVENRMEAGEPWYRQRIVEGPVNAISEIEFLEARSRFGYFRLLPRTGKKHQLRVHMASLGFPIVGDPLYPVLKPKSEGDPPLQLLARRLAFVDPLTGASLSFTSGRTLSLNED